MNTDPAAASSATPDPVPVTTNGASLADLRPLYELDKITPKVFEEMGLGSVVASEDIDGLLPKVDFSVVHFVILPQRSAWLDFMLETDRPSALKLFEVFSGMTEAADADLEDVLRETMNLIHGTLKVAFKGAGVDVIIPVVPQSIASEKLTGASSGGYSLHSRHVFTMDTIKLRLTMIARVAPVTRKELKNIRLAEVLVDPIAPDGDQQLVIVKKHTMLNKRLLAKVQDMAEYEAEVTRHPVIEPSPIASLIPNE